MLMDLALHDSRLLLSKPYVTNGPKKYLNRHRDTAAALWKNELHRWLKLLVHSDAKPSFPDTNLGDNAWCQFNEKTTASDVKLSPT